VQSINSGARVMETTVTDIDLSQRPFVIKTFDSEYQADSIVLATGAKALWLDKKREDKFKGQIH
jgi:thioredoxin reductase (NADPH)